MPGWLKSLCNSLGIFVIKLNIIEHNSANSTSNDSLYKTNYSVSKFNTLNLKTVAINSKQFTYVNFEC